MFFGCVVVIILLSYYFLACDLFFRITLVGYKILVYSRLHFL
jgi:hypothetical protein